MNSEPPDGAEPPPAELLEIVGRAQSAEPLVSGPAWADLEEQIRPLVETVVGIRLARDASVVDRATAVAEALTHIQQQLAKCNLTSAHKFRGWIRTVARHSTQDLLRRERRQAHELREPSDLDGVDPAAPEGLAHAEAEERKERVLRAIAQLPERQQELIELRYYAGYSISDLAEELDMSDSNVRYHLGEAMQRLRRKLGELDD